MAKRGSAEWRRNQSEIRKKRWATDPAYRARMLPVLRAQCEGEALERRVRAIKEGLRRKRKG